MSSISAIFITEKIGGNGASRSDLGHYQMEITHSEGLKGWYCLLYCIPTFQFQSKEIYF